MTVQVEGCHVGVSCSVLEGEEGWNSILAEFSSMDKHRLGVFDCTNEVEGCGAPVDLVFQTGQRQLCTFHSDFKDVKV